MDLPEIHVLNRIRWQFFGTLNFKSERMSQRRRHHLWFAFLRQSARFHKVPFGKLLWVLREEEGESFGRVHFHFLLAGLERRDANPSNCFRLMARWEQLGGGMARVSRFDPRLNAGSYLLKNLGDFDDSSLGGGAYESAKFGSDACRLTIAHSVWKTAKNQQR